MTHISLLFSLSVGLKWTEWKQKPPLHGTHRRTKWIEEGREQVREPEREGRPKGLAANPVHGQSWRSLIFLLRRCRQNSCWITTPYSIVLFKKTSPFFLCSDNLSKVWLSCVQRDQATEDKEAGRQAWWQDVSWTVGCHTWINLLSGRRCMAVDPPALPAWSLGKTNTEQLTGWDTQDPVRSLDLLNTQAKASKQQSGDTAILPFSCVWWITSLKEQIRGLYRRFLKLEGEGMIITAWGQCTQRGRMLNTVRNYRELGSISHRNSGTNPCRLTWNLRNG